MAGEPVEMRRKGPEGISCGGIGHVDAAGRAGGEGDAGDLEDLFVGPDLEALGEPVGRGEDRKRDDLGRDLLGRIL